MRPSGGGSLKAGLGVRQRVVKRSRVLESEVEADVPYEETRLARKAGPARRRLAVLLLLGAVGFLFEAGITRAPLMVLGALGLGAAAWGSWRGRLGGIVAAALIAVLATLIPFAFLFLGERALGQKVALGFVIAWAVAMLPDILTLVRDAELQHAYGRWARRG